MCGEETLKSFIYFTAGHDHNSKYIYDHNILAIGTL